MPQSWPARLQPGHPLSTEATLRWGQPPSESVTHVPFVGKAIRPAALQNGHLLQTAFSLFSLVLTFLYLSATILTA